MTREQAHKLWNAITESMKEIGICDHAVVISDGRPDEHDGDCDIQIIPKSIDTVQFDWTPNKRVS